MRRDKNKKRIVYKKIEWCHGEYYVTNDGRVYSQKRKTFLKGTKTSGYLYVGLKPLGESRYKRIAIHRIVCEAFHGPCKDPDMQVNHRNGNKLDNKPENLEWCSRTENIHHAWESGLAPYIADFNEERKCPIVGVDDSGHIVCLFLSIREAARNGHREWCIRICLNKTHKKHHGLYWRRVNDIVVELNKDKIQ